MRDGAESLTERRTAKRRAAALAAGRGEENDFAPLERLFDDMLDSISPAEARSLGREIAKDLRGANAVRIRENVQPDETAMEPRKRRASGRIRTKRLRDPVTDAKRSVRNERMFGRATTKPYLRMESSQGNAQVGFVGAMARIMKVHQYGEVDTVTRKPDSPKVVYPARVVLGITAEDRARVLDLILARVTP